MTQLKLGMVMDNIQTIKPYKDSSFAMLLSAHARGYEIEYITQDNIFIHGGTVYAKSQRLRPIDDNHNWFETQEARTIALSELDVIFIRLDPPFDSEYMYTCHALALVQKQGVLVVNPPEMLCNHNEKLFISEFADLCVPTLVSRRAYMLREFIDQHQQVILKPLDGMGGARIFKVTAGDGNTGVILETLLGDKNSVMAQKYIPEIKNGDKRILIINGKPLDYALARIPASGENRGNLAAGGSGVGQELSARDRHIATTVGKVLAQRQILFAGIDVIGEYLTEINITSPTCIRELDAQFGLDIAGDLMDIISQKLRPSA